VLPINVRPVVEAKMGKFSKKMGGKEVGDAAVYAAPHQGSKTMNINDVKNPPKPLKPNPNWTGLDKFIWDGGIRWCANPSDT